MSDPSSSVSFTAVCPCGVDATWHASLSGSPQPTYRITHETPGAVIHGGRGSRPHSELPSGDSSSADHDGPSPVVVAPLASPVAAPCATGESDNPET